MRQNYSLNFYQFPKPKAILSKSLHFPIINSLVSISLQKTRTLELVHNFIPNCLLPSHMNLLSFSVQFSSVTQSCPALCNPMNRSMPGLPVHHQIPESTHIHVHRVGDAIQPSHPLSSPSPPAPNLLEYQRLFK